MKPMIKSFPHFASLWLIIATLVLSACASGPELEKYPRREIDRPYTLPKGVATWHLLTLFAQVEDQNSSFRFGPAPFPLLWESSLGDDWNLIWFPLPLGVSHQFFQNESSRLGINLLSGFTLGSEAGFRYQPTISLNYRSFSSKDTALEIIPVFSPNIPFKSGQDFRWSASLGVGPLFQLSDEFALKPAASLDVSHGPYGSTSTLSDNFLFSNETNSSLGLGVSAVWSFARKWDLRPDYHYSGIGSKNHQKVHLAVLDFVLFW